MIKELTELVGISGAESDVKNYILSKITPYCDKVETDLMGNIIAKKIYNPDYKALVFAAHTDEVGFIITDITEDGYLKFDAIGETEPINIISSKVKINDTIGIIALKAIHLSTKEEREKKLKFSDLYIDIGAHGREEAEKFVQKGDYCSFISSTEDFGDNMLKGKAIADRAGCGILAEFISLDIKSKYNLTFVFSVQNKVYSRGAEVASHSLNNIDKIVVLDQISIEENDGIRINNGPVIEKNPSDNTKSHAFADYLYQNAAKSKLPIQAAVNSRMTDKRRFAENLTDCTAALLCIPCKYQNSPVCVIGKDDIESAKKILLALAEVD